MPHPNPTIGMRHVALFVRQFEATERFYTEVVGMRVEWRPDPDNVYLTSGHDNLALHRSTAEFGAAQHLDHIGFMLATSADVDAWHAHLAAHAIEISKQPKTHRDGARSFYCRDPDGNSVQFIFHPPLAPKS